MLNRETDKIKSARSNTLRQEVLLPGRLEPQGLQDVVAGHRKLGVAGRHEELGRAVHPVDRTGPPLDRRPWLDAPPPQQIASVQRQLPPGGEFERFPVGKAVGVSHPSGQHAERDLGPAGQPLELRQRVPGHAGRRTAGVHVEEPGNPQGRHHRRVGCPAGRPQADRLVARHHPSPRGFHTGLPSIHAEA